MITFLKIDNEEDIDEVFDSICYRVERSSQIESTLSIFLERICQKYLGFRMFVKRLMAGLLGVDTCSGDEEKRLVSELAVENMGNAFYKVEAGMVLAMALMQTSQEDP